MNKRLNYINKHFKMAKKKNTKKEEVKDPVVEQTAKMTSEKLATIQEFNRQNMGDMWIDPEKIPTDEDVAAAKKDFEDRTKALQDKKDYFIADKTNALRVAKFLKDFIEHGYWAARYYVGVINFCALMDDFIKDCEKEEKDLVLEYGPMQFACLMLENYMGKGLEDAKHMAEIWDQYVPIYDTLKELVNWYNSEVEACKRLQNRWGMMAQGYYLVLLKPEDHKDEQTDASAAKEDKQVEETTSDDKKDKNKE